MDLGKEPSIGISADTPSSSFGTKFKVEFFMLVILGILTVAEIIFKEAFISYVEPFARKISILLAGSVAAILPGIIYKGGEWYIKVLRGEHFTTREKGFVIFLMETGIALLLAIVLQRFIISIFPRYIKYIWILLVEWFLLGYIWFTRMKRYSFPLFYTVVTNLVVIAFAYMTYRYV